MYGQQFSNVIASAAKWVFFGFFGVILMGVLLGANLKESTWLNPEIGRAEAKRIEIEAAHQEATFKLQEQLAQAKTEAEIQVIQREQKMLDAQYEHDKQLLTQDVINKQRMADTIINLIVIVGTTTGITAAVGALIIAVAKAITILRSTSKKQSTFAPLQSIPDMQIIKPLPEREPYDPLETPQQRYERRLNERLDELTSEKEDLDKMAARMEALKNPANFSTEEYKKRPLAG
jgi:hypothetical protein